MARADWEEEGQRADPVALAGALVALLLGYLDAALPQVSADQSNANSTVAEEDMQVSHLCALHSDLLWFVRFEWLFNICSCSCQAC